MNEESYGDPDKWRRLEQNEEEDGEPVDMSRDPRWWSRGHGPYEDEPLDQWHAIGPHRWPSVEERLTAVEKRIGAIEKAIDDLNRELFAVGRM